MKNRPLNLAFFQFPAQIYPAILAEFWYTCRVNDDQTAIIGTYKNGQSTITLTEALLRQFLELPPKGSYVPFVTKEVARSSMALIGQQILTGVIKMNMFMVRWIFVV